MIVIFSGIGLTILLFGILEIAGCISERTALVLLIGGMDFSVFAGMVHSLGRRLNLLQIFLIFVIASIEVGLLIVLHSADAGNVALVFFLSLFFPIYSLMPLEFLHQRVSFGEGLSKYVFDLSLLRQLPASWCHIVWVRPSEFDDLEILLIVGGNLHSFGSVQQATVVWQLATDVARKANVSQVLVKVLYGSDARNAYKGFYYNIPDTWTAPVKLLFKLDGRINDKFSGVIEAADGKRSAYVAGMPIENPALDLDQPWYERPKHLVP
jgi:hypothetical protein